MAHTRTPETTPTDPAPPSGGSPWANKWTVLSAVLVALLVLAAAWIAFTRPAAPSAPHAAPGHTVPLPVGPAPGCGPRPGSQTPPSTAPATRWQLVGGMAAPTSPAVGPLTVDGGIGLCYSGDPLGALFAAANFTAAATSAQLRPAALDKLALPGPGRDAAIAATQQNPGTNNVGIQIAGFQFTSYERFTTGQLVATVSLALTSQGRLLALPLALKFDQGDWRVDIPVTGRPFDGMSVIPSLAGFVPWQGA